MNKMLQKCLLCDNPVKRPGKVYCSKSCASRDRKYKEKITLMCQQCSTSFQVWPYQEYTAKFCSMNCKRIADAEELRQRIGEKHPHH